MHHFAWKVLVVLLCAGSVIPAPDGRDDLGLMIQDLQRQIERMEERNARLEAELFNVKADSFGLKTRLEGEISNVKAENMELKMRLTQANADTVFLATISAETVPSATGERIIFDNDLMNPGGHYNPQQGAYTAPLNGYYQFSIAKTSGASQARMWLLVDEVRKAFYDMDFHEQGSGSSSPTGAFTINMQLTAGQIVRVENDRSTFIYGTHASGVMQSWFTGYMLYSL